MRRHEAGERVEVRRSLRNYREQSLQAITTAIESEELEDTLPAPESISRNQRKRTFNRIERGINRSNHTQLDTYFSAPLYRTEGDFNPNSSDREQLVGNFKETLGHLIDEQREEFDARGYPRFEDNDPYKLFSSLMRTNDFTHLMDEGTYFALHTRNLESFSDRIVGRINEDASFHMLKKRIPAGRILLSPARTNILYQCLNPFSETVGDVNKGINKTSVSDGLIVDTSSLTIMDFVEYTAARQKVQLEYQLHQTKYVSRKYPELFIPDAGYIIAVPRGNSQVVEPKVLQRVDVSVEEMPYTKKDLGKFSDFVISAYRRNREGSPTLQETLQYKVAM